MQSFHSLSSGSQKNGSSPRGDGVFAFAIIVVPFKQVGGDIKGDFHDFEEGGLKFACYHGTEPRIKEALIECGKYDVFLYGHTHKVRNEKVGNTLVLNPGTVHGFEHGPTIMIFDTKTQVPEVINL